MIVKHKRAAGISYVELVVAMALFAIALLAIIPTLSQAAQNMVYAQDAYVGHLQAQRVMLVVRDALYGGESPISSATQYVGEAFDFSFWVFGTGAVEFHSAQGWDADVAISGLSTTMAAHSQTIKAIVWGEYGQVLGRAIGMLY